MARDDSSLNSHPFARFFPSFEGYGKPEPLPSGRKQLGKHPLDSDRKRMSVILKCPRMARRISLLRAPSSGSSSYVSKLVSDMR